MSCKPDNSYFFLFYDARARVYFPSFWQSSRGMSEIVVKVVQRGDKERNPMRVSDKMADAFSVGNDGVSAMG